MKRLYKFEDKIHLM